MADQREHKPMLTSEFGGDQLEFELEELDYRMSDMDEQSVCASQVGESPNTSKNDIMI